MEAKSHVLSVHVKEAGIKFGISRHQDHRFPEAVWVRIRVQLELYRKCVYPAIYYGIHALGKIKGNEAMEIDRIQVETLKQILDLPTRTPYVGVLMEKGIWAAMDQLNCATLMFYHSVINSEEHLVTKIVLKYMYISSSVRRFTSVQFI